MIINFISGHGDISQKEWDLYYKPIIDKAIKNNERFIIGDYKGVDTKAQKYLFESQIEKNKVTIYHMFENPRINVGNFPTKGGFKTDKERDTQMTYDSNKDIAWVRPGKEKSGTYKNIKRRIIKKQ